MKNLILIILLLFAVSVSAQTYTKDNTNKQFNGNIKLPATKTKIGATTLTEVELQNVKKTATDTAQLSELVVLKTQLYINGTGLHYTYGDSTYTVSLSARTLTGGTTPPPVGGNLLTNGTFATNTDWELYGDWAISGGTCNKLINGAAGCLPSVQPCTYNTSYTITYDLIDVTGGEFWVYFGFGGAGHEGIHRTASGSYTDIITTAANSAGWEKNFNFSCNYGFLGKLDNLVITVTP